MNTPAKEIRTRFAPSPTGFLHVGGARTALFNFLYAKARNGKYIHRIEDTDQERSTKESERLILDSLRWLGIQADEGPEEGGPYGPYRQSERLSTYNLYTERLLAEGKAYPCFCTDSELEAKQNQSRAMGIPHVYDGKCRGLLPEEIERLKKEGRRHAIRFNVKAGEITVNDLVQGRVKFDAKLIGDFIIVKSDGFPSYNYAVVIDDYEMKITHVIRGVGHLSNTPRQILIHEALGLPMPEYAHISEIVGTDRKKLSKRRGATSVLFFRDLGYISEAFVNYMALLGWYPEDGVEFMPEDELKHKFDVARCSKSPAMFDFFIPEKDSGGEKAEKDDTTEAEFNPALFAPEELKKYINKKSKLNWLNNRYIRQMPLDSVWTEAKQFISRNETLAKRLAKDEAKLKHAFENIRVYLDTLAEAPDFLVEILKERLTLEAGEAEGYLKAPEAEKIVSAFYNLVKTKQPKTAEEFSAVMKETGEVSGAKGKQLFMTIRAASTGSVQGLELPNLFAILGWKALDDRVTMLAAQAGIKVS